MVGDLKTLHVIVKVCERKLVDIIWQVENYWMTVTKLGVKKGPYVPASLQDNLKHTFNTYDVQLLF